MDRAEMKVAMAMLTPAQNRLFRQIYGYGNVTASTDYVIDNMTDAHMEQAEKQIKATLSKMEK